MARTLEFWKGAITRARRSALPAALSLAFLVLSSMSSGPALAHGPRPAAVTVLLDPADPDFMLITTNVWGHLITTDGASSLHHICAEVSAGDGDLEGPTGVGLTHPADGARRLLIAGLSGLWASDDDGCTWHHPEGAQTTWRIGGLTHDPVGERWLATTRQGGQDNALLESRDAGASWQPTDLVGEYFLRQVRAHPTTGRVALTAYDRSTGGYILFSRRPDDAAWSARLLAPPWSSPEVMAIDALDDRRVLLRATDGEVEALLLVDEREEGEQVVFEIPPQALLTALHQDPAGAWLLAADAGPLQRSDDALTWTPVEDSLSLRCLVARDDALLGCTSQLQGQAALVSSLDQGATWTPLVRFEQACAPLACAQDSGACTADGWAFQVSEFREWGVEDDVCGLWPPPPITEDVVSGDDLTPADDVASGDDLTPADDVAAGDDLTPADAASGDDAGALDDPADGDDGACAVQATRADRPGRAPWHALMGLLLAAWLIRRAPGARIRWKR